MLNVRIRQHCCAAGYDLYNEEVCPSSDSEKVIHLLWCKITGDVINHLVPLMECVTNKRKIL